MQTASLDMITAMLHDAIDLTQVMGLRATAYDGETLALHAPIEPNLNHKQTAFGGSLYSACVLAGWALLNMRLKEAGIERHVVIHRASISNPQPVVEDFDVKARFSDPADWDDFLATVKADKRARTDLKAKVPLDKGNGARFKGTYVVL